MIEKEPLRSIKRSMYWLIRDLMGIGYLADEGYGDEKELTMTLEIYDAALAEYCKLYLKTFKGKTLAQIKKGGD